MHLCRSFCHFYTPIGYLRRRLRGSRLFCLGGHFGYFFYYFFWLQQRIGFLYGFLTSWLAFLTYDLTICIKGSRIVTD